MDAVTELTWTYLQRPPQPDPPRHPTDSQLLLLTLTLLRQVQGCKPCNPTPSVSSRPRRWQPRCDDTEQWQERGQLIDEFNAGPVCQQAPHGSAKPAHTESKAEEQAGYHADAVRHHLLRVHHDGRERRGEHEADQHCQHCGP